MISKLFYDFYSTFVGTCKFEKSWHLVKVCIIRMLLSMDLFLAFHFNVLLSFVLFMTFLFGKC